MAKKTKTPAVPAPDQLFFRSAVVDRFVLNLERIKAFKPIQKEHDEDRKTILSWGVETAPAESVEYLGMTGKVTLSAQANERKIVSMAAVAKFFGARFNTLCTFALKHMDSEMNEAERAKYLTEARTGARTISAETRIPKDQK